MPYFALHRSLLFWGWVVTMAGLIGACAFSIGTTSALSYRGYTLFSKYGGLNLSLQNPGLKGLPSGIRVSNTPIPAELAMGLRWGRPLFVKHHEPVPAIPSPYSSHDPTVDYKWWDSRHSAYSNGEQIILSVRTLCRQGDWLLHVPYWVIAAALTPLCWAGILWMGCRHAKAGEMAMIPPEPA